MSMVDEKKSEKIKTLGHWKNPKAQEKKLNKR